jgi:quinol monooxygenase YgiN
MHVSMQEMIVLQVSMTAKDAHTTDLEGVLRDVVRAARQCRGCLRYEWFRMPENDRQYFAYGEFASADAFAEYRQGPVVRMIVETLMPLLESRPGFTHFRATVMEHG